MTKSVHYRYDIEYVKHYNYYDSECLEDTVDIMDTKEYDENENRSDIYQQPESIIETDLNDGFEDEDVDADAVPELQEVADRSFSFTRVSREQGTYTE